MTRPRVKYPVVSLFSGAMGLDSGLDQAGLSIRVAVESNAAAVATIKANRPRLPVFDKPINQVATDELLKRAGLRVGEAFAVVGGPSCQTFSTAGQRGSISDQRGTMFREFVRVVKEARPRFFIMENVRGVLSAAIRHRPLAKRGPGHPHLTADEELGSAFRLMLSELAETNYYVLFDLLNAADYGAPQIRHRLIVLGSRDGELLTMPPATHSEAGGKGVKAWLTLGQTLTGLDDRDREFEPVGSRKAALLQLIPPGGNWRSLPKAKQRSAIGSAYDSWGGRSGFLRRLDWDAPAPSVTSRPSSKATFMCHPDEVRPLTVVECARLQQFPPQWKFEGSLLQKYSQIGNAVPVGLGRALGRHLRFIADSGKRNRRSDLCGQVATSESTLTRMSKRPRTVLNPKRMREVVDTKSAKAWLAHRPAGYADRETLTITSLPITQSRTRAKVQEATG